MRLRKHSKIDGTLLALMRELCTALDGAISTYVTLHERFEETVLDEDERSAAVAAAKRLSAYYLFTHRAVLMRFKPKDVLEVWLPARVFEAIGRFEYALTALGEPDPEPEALLAPAEIEQVIDQYGLRTWMDGMHSPDGPYRLDQTT